MRIPLGALLDGFRRTIRAPHVVPRETENRLLFRFGYLLHAAAAPPAGSALWSRLRGSWATTAVGPFVLVTHPETPVSRADRDDRSTVLVGDAFFTVEPLGRAPLEALAAADGDELLDVLDQLSGRFAVIARRDGRTHVYHDAFGARSVFYRHSGPLGLASHPELFAHTFGDRRWPEMTRFVQSDWFRHKTPAMLPGDATVYDGILALLPNHGYALEERRPFRYWPRRERRRTPATFEEFFAAIDTYFRALAAFVAGRPVIVSITGGIDSRTLIAALRHYGVPLRTVTWWGRYYLEEWERQPIREIAAHLGGEHAWVDDRNDGINDEALIGARNSGNYRRPSQAVAGMARLFGTIPGALWLPGQGAAAIRGWPPPRIPLPDLRPETLLNDYFRRGSRPPTDEDRRFVLRAIEAMLARVDLATPLAMGYDPEDTFFWEHRTGTWSVCSINAMHSAVDCMFGFNSRVLAEVALALPPELRRTKKAFHEMIRRYDERLAAIHYQ